jgi:hypothetical protein
MPSRRTSARVSSASSGWCKRSGSNGARALYQAYRRPHLGNAAPGEGRDRPAVYVTAPGRRVVILPVFTKKTQKTPRREIELARQRTTVSGRTFQVSPPWIWVTLTTALFERMVKHAARHTIISGPPAGSERGGSRPPEPLILDAPRRAGGDAIGGRWQLQAPMPRNQRSTDAGRKRSADSSRPAYARKPPMI